jgi:hypothetical protein
MQIDLTVRSNGHKIELRRIFTADKELWCLILNGVKMDQRDATDLTVQERDCMLWTVADSTVQTLGGTDEDAGTIHDALEELW